MKRIMLDERQNFPVTSSGIHKMNEKIFMDYCYIFWHTNNFILKALHCLA